MNRRGLLLLLSVLALLPGFAFAQLGETGPDRRFGVMTHFAHGWDPVWADIGAVRGIRAVRDEIYWDAVEREKGVFAFPRTFDAYLAALRRHDIDPLIVLSFENRNYDGGDTPHSAEGIAAFARYGTEVLKRYGDAIKVVEIWNEYNGTFNKGPATLDRAGSYTRLLREAYARIKQVRSDVTVLGGATAGVPLPYWEKLMQNGALDAMDALSIHPYRYDAAPEGIESEIAALQELVRKYNGGRTKPIWVTEIGWGTQEIAPAGAVRIDDATQARYLVRAYALLLSSQVERVYWYLLRDYEEFTLGLTTADARPKLAAFAMQVMASELAAAPFARRDATPPELYSLLFVRPGGEEVRVIWSLKPLEIDTAGATRVVDLEGRQRSVPTRLVVDDTPLFVTGKLRALPPPPVAREVRVTDAHSGFSSVQGADQWSYGEMLGSDSTFHLLPTCTVSDWNVAWGGQHPYLSITAGDQHPSVGANGTPVASVRRWTSDRTATLHLVGEFRVGAEGDGVRVSVVVNGQPLFHRAIGGGNAVAASFDLEAAVDVGSTVDFAVDPGPAGNISYDATRVSVSISAR